MNAARRERAALLDTLRTVGPDAPPLCTGWTARDLAAHLVVRGTASGSTFRTVGRRGRACSRCHAMRPSAAR